MTISVAENKIVEDSPVKTPTPIWVYIPPIPFFSKALKNARGRNSSDNHCTKCGSNFRNYSSKTSDIEWKYSFHK